MEISRVPWVVKSTSYEVRWALKYPRLLCEPSQNLPKTGVRRCGVNLFRSGPIREPSWFANGARNFESSLKLYRTDRLPEPLERSMLVVPIKYMLRGAYGCSNWRVIGYLILDELYDVYIHLLTITPKYRREFEASLAADPDPQPNQVEVDEHRR